MTGWNNSHLEGRWCCGVDVDWDERQHRRRRLEVDDGIRDQPNVP